MASFSPKRSSRWTHSIGVSSPCSATRSRAWLGDRGVGVVEDLGAGDDRQPLVEQVGERADHAGLGLAPLAQEDHVVAGQDGVLELRQDGLLVAEDALDQGLAGQDAGHGVAPDLLLDGHRLPAGLAELTDGCGTRRHSWQPTRVTCRMAARRTGGSRRRDPAPGAWSFADPDAGRLGLGAGHRPRPLAGHAGLRRDRRAPALPGAVRRRPARRRRAGLAGVRRRLLPVRRLAGRRLRGRHRGLLLRPHLRGHRGPAGPGRAPPGRRGRVQPARRPHGQAQPDRRLPALGLHRPRPEPRRHLAARAPRADRAGPAAPAVGRLHRGGRRVGHAALPGLRRHGRAGRRQGRHDRRRPGRPTPRSSASPPARTSSSGRSPSPSPTSGGPGPSATSPATTSRSRPSARTASSATPSSARSACARWSSTTGSCRSTASACS